MSEPLSPPGTINKEALSVTIYLRLRRDALLIQGLIFGGGGCPDYTLFTGARKHSDNLAAFKHLKTLSLFLHLAEKRRKSVIPPFAGSWLSASTTAMPVCHQTRESFLASGPERREGAKYAYFCE